MTNPIPQDEFPEEPDSDDDLLRRLDQTVIAGTGWGMPRIDGISLDVVAGRAADRIRALERENKERAEIVENHRKSRKVAEAELADRRSHDAERQQEWFVTQRRAERAEAERDAAIKALRELLAGCTDPDHDCIQEIAAARAVLAGPNP